MHWIATLQTHLLLRRHHRKYLVPFLIFFYDFLIFSLVIICKVSYKNFFIFFT